MLAIQGIYDGVNIKPKEAIPFTEEYEVVITFLKPLDTPNAETLIALEEIEQMKKNPSLGKAYIDVDEMIKDLLA